MTCRSCHCSKASRGFRVETYSGVWSGAQWQPVCNLGNRQDVYHIVKITNKSNYPVDVVCDGSISMTAYRKVQFNSPTSTDTDHTWQYSDQIGINRDKTFPHVQLSSRNVGHGSEDVQTDVSATLVNWGTSLQPVTVIINVIV